MPNLLSDTSFLRWPGTLYCACPLASLEANYVGLNWVLALDVKSANTLIRLRACPATPVSLAGVSALHAMCTVKPCAPIVQIRGADFAVRYSILFRSAKVFRNDIACYRIIIMTDFRQRGVSFLQNYIH